MKFSRRDFVHAGCAIAATTLVPTVADAWIHGSTISSLSQRNVLNLNSFSFGTNDYAFIDHLQAGPQALSPLFGAFGVGVTGTFSSLIDANGYPNDATASGQNLGGTFQIPDPTNFAGPYIIDVPASAGGGNGTINFNNHTGGGSPLTFTVNSSTNVTVAGNGSYQITGGASGGSVNVTLSGNTIPGPQQIVWTIAATGGSGFFIKKVRFYRSADATDLAAGKIFRVGWKQPIVNLCPSAIRFMDIVGGNADRNCRFENRTLPNIAGYCLQSQWTVSPSYSTNATGTNQYVVAAATPTSTNAKTTPASMVHGEIATVRFANGFARASSSLAITGITNAANGVVTTSVAHGYSTGDIIGHYLAPLTGKNGVLNGTTTVTGIDITNLISGMFVYGPGIPAGTTINGAPSGSTITLSSAATISANVRLAFQAMKNLHLFPCTITSTGANTYQLNVNTTSFGPFAIGGEAISYQFVTVQVGSGSDRTAYPLVFPDGNTPASFFGGNYLNSGDYKTIFFDKTTSAKTDGSGNYVLGVWMVEALPFQVSGFSGDFPIEVCTALVNELNAMSPARTIGMWMNIPCMGLSSMDPDHTTGSDWSVNAMDVILNPSSSVRAGGFSALGYSGASKLNSPQLIVEYSNELWPSGTNNDGRGYLINRGIQRYGSAIIPSVDWQDLKALRSSCWVRDVKAAMPSLLSNTKFVIGLWGFVGISSGGDFGNNYATTFGGNVGTPQNFGDWYTNDALVTGGSWARPIDNHDGVCIAPYLDPPDTYYNTISGTGTYTDDSAMYNGVDNSGTLSMTGGTGGVASTTLTITAVAAGTPIVNQPLVGTGITSPNTTIIGVSGVNPNYTLTLSRAATVTNGTTIKSATNSGGNYIGAANQSQALANFVAKVVDIGNVNNSGSTTNWLSILQQYTNLMPTGKAVLSYEGGTNWPSFAGAFVASFSHQLNDSGDPRFSMAVNNSAQFATAQTNFFNSYSGIAKAAMPSIFIWIQGAGQQWAYCSPDSYAGGTEGQALLNNPTWVALSSRNQGLPN